MKGTSKEQSYEKYVDKLVEVKLFADASIDERLSVIKDAEEARRRGVQEMGCGD